MAVVRSYTQANTSLTAGHLYVIGAAGDDDPQIALEGITFANPGSVARYVGHSLTDILTNTRYLPVAATSQTAIEGPRGNLLVYTTDTATAGSFGVSAIGTRRNSGQDAGVLCAQGNSGSATHYQVIRPSKAAGADTETTVPVSYRRTITSIKAYSVTVATGATITVDLQDADGNSLLASVMDAEALTTKTLYTSTTLTTSTNLLTVDRDLTIVYSSSAGGDTLGDILIEIAHTRA